MVRLLILFLFLILSGCPQPVVRKSEPEPNATKEPWGPKINLDYNKPDIRKRFWVIPTAVYVNPPKEFAKLSLDKSITKSLEKVFAEETKSPFILPGKGDFSLDEYGVDATTAHSDISKLARAASVPGFMTTTISTLEFREEGGNEGLLESTSYIMTVGVDFKVFDSAAGRLLAEGYEKHTMLDKRSNFLGKGLTVSVLQAKFDSLSLNLADKIFSRVAQYSEKLGWSGRIIKIDATRAYINAGRRSGIKLDDVLKVMELSRDVYDPDSAKYMGTAPGRIKGTIKVIQYFGEDGAVAVIQSGGGFVEGDSVELY